MNGGVPKDCEPEFEFREKSRRCSSRLKDRGDMLFSQSSLYWLESNVTCYGLDYTRTRENVLLSECESL